MDRQTFCLLFKGAIENHGNPNHELLAADLATEITVKDVPEHGDDALPDSPLIQVQRHQVPVLVSHWGPADSPHTLQQSHLLNRPHEFGLVQLPVTPAVTVKRSLQPLLVPWVKPPRKTGWKIKVFNRCAKKGVNETCRGRG